MTLQKDYNKRQFKVVSDAGQLMGVFNSEEAANKFMEEYSALKSYSKNLNEVGNIEALKQFREKLARDNI